MKWCSAMVSTGVLLVCFVSTAIAAPERTPLEQETVVLRVRECSVNGLRFGTKAETAKEKLGSPKKHSESKKPTTSSMTYEEYSLGFSEEKLDRISVMVQEKDSNVKITDPSLDAELSEDELLEKLGAYKKRVDEFFVYRSGDCCVLMSIGERFHEGSFLSMVKTDHVDLGCERTGRCRTFREIRRVCESSGSELKR